MLILSATTSRPGLMMAVHGSYLILFRVKNEHIEIVRITHGARDLSRLFAR